MAFQRACSLSELTDGKALPVEVEGVDVALVRIGEELFAIEDECSHAAVALSEGDVESAGGVCSLECWMHGSRFDLRTGEPLGPPATDRVPTYPVRLEGDDVLVDVAPAG